jgi:endo-1,4-beta-xylanase
MGISLFVLASLSFAQSLPPLPAPQAIPKPGPVTDAPYAPQAIAPGGVVIPLYPPGSPFLKADRVWEAEVYNMSQTVPGRINSIVNIHNPSIEFHPVDRGLNTGAVIILVAGGGHNTLNVGPEAVDFIPFFYNYGINTVILRNRLRKDGYIAEVDAVNDALQSIRMVRAYAKQWNLDPNKIGMMGFSAGAELAAPASVLYEEFDKKNSGAGDPLAGISSRPDFVGIIYPGPSPFAKNRTAPPIPKTTPPSFLVCASSGDKVHAVWAMEYFNAVLGMSIPNIEMHLYGTGRHGGGITDRNGAPLGTWQFRFIDWFRDLGFLQKPGVETRAARESAAFAAQPAK